MVISLVLDSVLDLTTMVIFLVIFLLCFYVVRRPRNLPPGPRFTLPVIGNMLYCIGKKPLELFEDMREIYGDIFSLELENHVVVVLNNYHMIKEALVKKGKFFSARPVNYQSQKLGENKGVVFVSGQFWQEQRKFTVQTLKCVFSEGRLQKLILKEAVHLNSLLKTKVGEAVDLDEYLSVCALNTMTTAFGSTRFEYEDIKPRLYCYHQEQALNWLSKEGVLTNTFPFLKYVPGDPLSIKKVEGHLKYLKEFVTEMYERNCRTLDEANPKNFIEHFVLEMSRRQGELDSNFTLDQLLFLVINLIVPGTSTTKYMLQWTLLHLLENPHIQKRVQEEIMNVIGEDRMPELDDQSNMPYVQATILEVLRLSHPSPLSIPHATTETLQFQGYTIPKGSTIITNLNSIFKDPRIWKDPTEFQPERFLGQDGKVINQEDFIPFGIGRRICLAEVMGRAELFLFVTCIYQRFSLVVPDGNVSDGRDGTFDFFYRPKPFKLKIIQGHL